MAYERSAGTAIATCENWCRHLTDQGTFSTASAPTRAQVLDWLAFGQADVSVMLSRYSYGTALPANPQGAAWLEKMNCLRACMNIEMTYPVTEWGQPNQRMTMFQTQWDEGVQLLAEGSLDLIGLEPDATDGGSGAIEITGTSRSQSLSRQLDPDRIAGKFNRGFGQSGRVPANRFDPNVVE